MKVYITADIEGTTGTTHPDETDMQHDEYKAFREQMTAEVVAACEGALEAGATEIWIKDAHATARNIIPSKLPKEAKLVRGWSGHPFMMVQELDETFQAAMMIGYHARAGSDASPLAHTMTGKVTHIKINDDYASEFLLHAYAASYVNVPVVFISGDSGICQEAEALVPGIKTVAVKHGVGGSTVSIHPALATEAIRSNAHMALKETASKLLITMPERFVVEITYEDHARAYQSAFFPGASLKDSHSIQFEATDYFEVLRFLLFVI